MSKVTDRMNEGNWIKRRWLEFRNGHSIYLVFPMAFINFIVVTYALAIERLPALKEIIPSMSHWIIIFLAIYLPTAIIIGRFHMKRVMPNESKQLMELNPYAYKQAPGRDELFSIPSGLLGTSIQLKGMKIHNQLADALNAAHNAKIGKWSKQDMEVIEWTQAVMKELSEGKNIVDIIKDHPKPDYKEAGQ